MVTAIIPTYRSPQYLDLCLKSAVENKTSDETKIICIVDGYVDESQHIIDKYNGVGYIPLSSNRGMQYAINVGVMNAETEWVFVLNDDNVFGQEWDLKIENGLEFIKTYKDVTWKDRIVMTPNQVEPAPSIFNFVTKDMGRTAESFDYNDWQVFEPSIATNEVTDDGRIFPFVINKKWFMAVGGFDTFYDSPFWCDVDFWLKLELLNQLHFHRWHGMHLYHFGSMATKNRGDADAALFKQSESKAAQTFYYKWGYLPNLVRNARERNNTKIPEAGVEQPLRGIDPY